MNIPAHPHASTGSTDWPEADSGRMLLQHLLGPLPTGRDFGFGYCLDHVAPDGKAELTLTKGAASVRVWIRPATNKTVYYRQTSRFKVGYEGELPDRDGIRVVDQLYDTVMGSESQVPDAVYAAFADNRFERTELVPWGDKLELRVTIGCNESCGFCNSDATVQNHCKSEAAVVDAIRRTPALRIKEIVFTGGEPTLMAGLPGWVQQARRLGLKVWLQTNGTMRDPVSYWERFRDADGKLLLPHHIVMSMHTRFPERVQLITGLGGTFERKLATVRSALALGIDCRLSHVISIHNLDETPDFPDWVADTFGRAVSIQFSFVAPTGHGASHPELMPRVRDAAPRLAQALDAARRRGVRAMVTDVCGIPPCALPRHRRFLSLTMRPADLVTMGQERMKFDFCGQCAFDQTCTGFWRKYVELYGTDEFAPIELTRAGRVMEMLRRLRALPRHHRVRALRPITDRARGAHSSPKSGAERLTAAIPAAARDDR